MNTEQLEADMLAKMDKCKIFLEKELGEFYAYAIVICPINYGEDVVTGAGAYYSNANAIEGINNIHKALNHLEDQLS